MPLGVGIVGCGIISRIYGDAEVERDGSVVGQAGVEGHVMVGAVRDSLGQFPAHAEVLVAVACAPIQLYGCWLGAHTSARTFRVDLGCAGMNRHEEGDESALHRRALALINGLGREPRSLGRTRLD